MDWERMVNIDLEHMIDTVPVQLEPVVYGLLLLVCVVAQWRSKSRAAVWLTCAAGLALAAALVLRGRIIVSPLETPMVIHAVCRFAASIALLCGGVRLAREQKRAEAEALAYEGSFRQMSQAAPLIPPTPAAVGLVALHVLTWTISVVGAAFLVSGALGHHRRTRGYSDIPLGGAAACYGAALCLAAMADATYVRIHHWLPVPYQVFDFMSKLGRLRPWVMLLAELLALVGGVALLVALLRPRPAPEA